MTDTKLSSRMGVLFVNLGTPDAPTNDAVRRYLREFLSDPRVVELPRLIWLPILYGLILPTRPSESAKKYQKIWTNEGSPLQSHTRHQAALFRGLMRKIQRPIFVGWAMRYGQPSIVQKLDAMKDIGCDKIMVIPLYPQYASSTTGSVMDVVTRWSATTKNPPEIRSLRHFHDDPAYIDVLANRVRKHWESEGRGDHLLISFHGTPVASRDRGDPYYYECMQTARLLVDALGLMPDQYTVFFQSRFGKAKWLEPYTHDVLEMLGSQRLKNLDVICPGFVSDCLETLEEIAIEGKYTFSTAGGGNLRYIPALNAEPDWIVALGKIVANHIQDWLTDDSSHSG